MSNNTRKAADIDPNEWEHALREVVRRQMSGAKQAWVTYDAVWIPADKVESGLRRELALTPGFDRPFGCVEQLIIHEIVPAPRACALLWRIEPGNTSVKQVMLLEVPPRLARGVCPAYTYWSLEEVDANQVTYLAILRSDTKVPQGSFMRHTAKIGM
ncbi:hypothetical protein [Vreelandella zhaodongensis]|uniref:hypothetical protein n=1 Tax=Vreelandella zhaodongensis TaxID=1176240 RepID=UPI003EB75AF4